MYGPGGGGREDPLGIYGPTPPPPPQEQISYAEMVQKYPAMFPPGMMPPQYNPQQQQNVMMGVVQVKSKFPGVAFVFSILALLANVMMLLDFILLFMEIANDITTDEELCCLSMMAFWLAALVLTFLAILLSSIAFYRVKTNKYEPHKRAKPAFIFSIISGALFILVHIVALVFFLMLVGV